MIKPEHVGIAAAAAAAYPRHAPFHPAVAYPEYPFTEASEEPNEVYAAARELFRILQLDVEHYGLPSWNPLGEIITPGDKVVLKPNFVMDRHYTGGDYDSVVTHGSVLRAILDYVAIALKGKGEIIVADAPMIDNDFQRIMQQTGLQEIARFYASQGLHVAVYDLRVENVETKEGLIVRRFKLPGDPAGYVPIDLGSDSEFAQVSHWHQRYRGSDYDSGETARHHNEQVNEYLLSKTVLEADVFINLPKLKTHKKIGVTLNLKNLIGINGDKNWIPHYRLGSPGRNGDEFAMSNTLRHIESLVKDRFKEKAFAWAESNSRVGMLVARKLRGVQKAIVENTNLTKIRAGGWHGNDTIWRAVLDLNRILHYAGADGKMHETPQRKILSVIDGIIGGEGDGPLITRAKPCGVLLGGGCPLAVDLCATRLMGFDYRKIPQFENALCANKYPLMNYLSEQIICLSNAAAWRDVLHKSTQLLNFQAATGWEGKIEVIS